MSNLLKRIRVFLLLSFILLTIEFILLITFNKPELHLFFNRINNSFLDTFFKYFTNLGSGLFILIIGIILFFKKIRYGFYVLISWVLSGLLAQLIKHMFFPHSERPVTFFQGISELHLVEGVKQLNHYSFPSGHSVSAFGLFLCLSVIYNKPAWQVLCFCFALLISYSRVYLSQHFLCDIWFGSLLGIFCTIPVIFYINRFSSTWLDKSIISIIKRKDDQHS